MRSGLRNGRFQQDLNRVYGAEAIPPAERFLALLDGFCDFYGKDEARAAGLFSTPGRAELVGNHTDHQLGHSLAAGVAMDTIACASPNGEGVIRIKSAGHRLAEVRLDALAPVAGERGHSPALVRGVAARIAGLGYPVGGFDAYTTTQVLRGRGLSSSAAFEVMTGVIINQLYCRGALTSVQLAQAAQYAENVYFGKPCGLLDQMACAAGGVFSLSFGEKEQPQLRRLQFDPVVTGYALCVVDSGVSHAGLLSEFSAIPREMEAVAHFFGCRYLAQVTRETFIEGMADARKVCGDRAILRALHFFQEDQLAQQAEEAILRGEMSGFLDAVTRSGRSSFMYLQNVSTYRDPRCQELAVMLALAEQLLEGRGACRVHGGGFAGTIQAFVPLDMVERFCACMEKVTGRGSCHRITFRSAGAGCVIG